MASAALPALARHLHFGERMILSIILGMVSAPRLHGVLQGRHVRRKGLGADDGGTGIRRRAVAVAVLASRLYRQGLVQEEEARVPVGKVRQFPQTKAHHQRPVTRAK